MSKRLRLKATEADTATPLLSMEKDMQELVFANVASHQVVIPENYDGPQWHPASWQRVFTLTQVTTPVVAAACSRDHVEKHYMKFVKEADISLCEIRTALKMRNLCGACTSLREQLRPRFQITELHTLRSENERVLSVRFRKDNKEKAVVIRVHRMSPDTLHQSNVGSIVPSERHSSLVHQMKAILGEHMRQIRYFNADVAIDLTEMLQTLSGVEHLCNPGCLYGMPGSNTAARQTQILKCDRIVYRRVLSWLKRHADAIVIHSCTKPARGRKARISILVRFDVYTIEAIVAPPDTVELPNADAWAPWLLQAAKAPRTLALSLAARVGLDASDLQVQKMWMDQELDDDTREKLSVFLRGAHEFDSSEEHYAATDALLRHKPSTIRGWINSHRSVWYKHIFCTFNFFFDKHH